MINPVRFLLCMAVSITTIGPLPHAAASASSQAAAAIRVVSPPDKAWVTEEKLFLAGTVQDNTATNVLISGVKSSAPKAGAPVENGAFGALITLKDGRNTVKLRAGNQSETIDIYYQTAQMTKAGKKPPTDYSRFYVHTNPAPLNCKECHRLKNNRFDFRQMIPARSNCTSGSCHSDMGKAKHVHGPVGAGVCISCHNPHGSKEELFLQRTGGALCLICHQAKQEEFAKEVVHSPVEDGCIDCHDPHQSSMRFQLKGEGPAVSSLCFTCHEDAIFTKSHAHEPVGAGDCVACHNPHASNFNSLLIASPENGELCFQCHQSRKEEFTMKYIHAPVKQNCNLCHDPHSSEAKFQLIEEGGELCAMCHKELHPEVYADIANAKYEHKPVKLGRCTDCHRPHSSNVRPLLKKPMEQLCLTCHTDLADKVAESKYRHGPVKTGDCTACHKPHGSTFSRMLVRYFPKEFYSKYQEEKYDLCFGCHNKEIAKRKFTSTLTNFRDGEYNLHYFHVNQDKGRNCIACHDAHASDQPKHIRMEVPFGAWSYPISLTKTKTGGTCIVGCHAPKTYDRKNPQITPSK